jgi:hypothetical protein
MSYVVPNGEIIAKKSRIMVCVNGYVKSESHTQPPPRDQNYVYVFYLSIDIYIYRSMRVVSS